MVFVIGIYAAIVYLVFFKFRWLPLNTATKAIIVGAGVFILLSVITALRIYTPATAQAAVTTRILEIAPQVSGRIDEVLIKRSVVVEEGTVLFTIDPTAYKARVDGLEAQLSLSKLRQQQFKDLAAAKAGSQCQYQQAEAQTRQLDAQLAGARFDLENTKVRAPSRGMVPRLFLKRGTQVSPSKAVITFLDISDLMVGGLFQQAALQHVKVGDRATVSFPALPGRVFETKVTKIPKAIGDVQFLASGQLPKVANVKTTKLYPIYVALPDDFPDHVEKIGLAAVIYIHTENAGAISMVALAMQWISASLAILV
jgi:multidrug resistance efflux pump